MFTFVPVLCSYKMHLSSFLFMSCINSNWREKNKESGLERGQKGREALFTYSTEADLGGHLVHHVFG